MGAPVRVINSSGPPGHLCPVRFLHWGYPAFTPLRSPSGDIPTAVPLRWAVDMLYSFATSGRAGPPVSGTAPRSLCSGHIFYLPSSSSPPPFLFRFLPPPSPRAPFGFVLPPPPPLSSFPPPSKQRGDTSGLAPPFPHGSVPRRPPSHLGAYASPTFEGGGITRRRHIIIGFPGPFGAPGPVPW